MDRELGIYNKLGGGEKYKTIPMVGGSIDAKGSEDDNKKKRIQRLEDKIATLENELKKLKENELKKTEGK
tara:strand:- start:298 stop:507 length:210 start_codon:yes stop_codon:yes gene_type:complete